MSDTSIKFENVGKLYRLGTVGTGTLSHDLKRWWITSVRGKEDPYLKIGETNDRSSKGSSEYVYALQDINFEVKQGEALGIIGKNGAGKSTLLKLLSRVTAPTTGKIYTKGRIASLLEVGTGFHPELTGRENIYMNGTIMGMKKWEIDRKLDEIVDFSGCERYLDTPVKRYSSGMMVRLGFAVAAHLEPEILVVDEVLAVGDAEFQKKAIGKMQDVSRGEGRTVLFVSHNMDSIQNLCKTGMLLEYGMIKMQSADIQEVVSNYLSANNTDYYFLQSGSSKSIYVHEVKFIGDSNHRNGLFRFNDSVEFNVVIRRKGIIDPKMVMGISVETVKHTLVGITEVSIGSLSRKDEVTYNIKLPPSLLMPQQYLIKIDLYIPNVMFFDRQETCVFRIFDEGSNFQRYYGANNGIIMLNSEVNLVN